MTDDTSPKKPSFIAYQVNEAQDGKAHFNRVGAAFEHGDGEGHNILLDALPVNGRITLRCPQDRLDDMRNEGGKEGRQQGTQPRQAPPAPEPDR